jgi:hypothetical protein
MSWLKELRNIIVGGASGAVAGGLASTFVVPLVGISAAIDYLNGKPERAKETMREGAEVVRKASAEAYGWGEKNAAEIVSMVAVAKIAKSTLDVLDTIS